MKQTCTAIAPISLLIGFLLGWILCFKFRPPTSAGTSTQPETAVRVDTISVMKRDTVLITAPPLNVKPLPRYILARLQRTDTVTHTDTVEVRVPLSQYTYTDTLCRLVATGFAVTFDTISIHAPERIVTLTRTVRDTRPWHIGIQAGAAITPRGLQPSLSVGITYTLHTF